MDLDLGIPDEAYWPARRADPLRLVVMQVAQKLWATRRDTIVIGVPRQVVLEERSTLPVEVMRGCTYEEAANLDLGRDGALAVMELTRNRLRLGRLRSGDEEEENHHANTPLPEGQTTDRASVELRESFDLPWEPGEYLVTVLLGAQRSNTGRVQLVRAGAPAVATRAQGELTLSAHAGGPQVEGRLSWPVSAGEVPPARVALVVSWGRHGQRAFEREVAMTTDESGGRTGTFEFELPQKPHPVFVYAFSGALVAGPVRLEP